MKSILIRHFSPVLLFALLIGVTFALEIREMAVILGGALGSITDPIYLFTVVIISVFATFKASSFVGGAIGIAIVAALVSGYVAYYVHPQLGVHSTQERQLLVWVSRSIGGIAVLSLIWSVGGIIALFKNTSSQSVGN